MNYFKTNNPYKKWKNKAQKFELNFHINNEWRPSEDFENHSRLLFNFFGFKEDSFTSKNILDLGAGSKLRTKYFKGSKIFVIEPLADEFIKNIEWCDLMDAEKVYSIASEEVVAELVNNIDYIFCINVLDHCYDLDKIIYNCNKYLKINGSACLSFDIHEEDVDDGHPIHIEKTMFENILTENGFETSKIITGLPDEDTDSYGHGDAITYFVKKIKDL
tara:strand:+ start:8628 stop:9281 length:654 start_codon:yes stop_codon:yes gene_type:complete